MNFLTSHLFSHSFIHVAALIALGFYFIKRGHSHKKVIVLLTISFLVDLDHLITDPIYDPNRCGIGFHPLHQYWMIGIYVIGLFFRKTRILASGLIAHMVIDLTDCF